MTSSLRSLAKYLTKRPYERKTASSAPDFARMRRAEDKRHRKRMDNLIQALRACMPIATK